jgi:hypothetical protein
MTGGAGHTGGPHHGFPTGGAMPGPKHYSTLSLPELFLTLCLVGWWYVSTIDISGFVN